MIIAATFGVFAAASLYLAVALVLLLSKRWRKFAFRSGLVALVIGVGAVYVGSNRMDDDARAAGFDGVQDQRNATKAGITSADRWHQQRDKVLAQWAAEAKAAEAKELAAKQAEDTRCIQNDDCLAKRHERDANRQCKPFVERFAKYDFRWTGSIFDRPFFSFYIDRRERTIRYAGSNIEFQNGFGIWQKYRYECLFSFQLEKIINAAVSER